MKRDALRRSSAAVMQAAPGEDDPADISWTRERPAADNPCKYGVANECEKYSLTTSK